jgi:hypothetical protein
MNNTKNQWNNELVLCKDKQGLQALNETNKKKEMLEMNTFEMKKVALSH